MSKYIFLDNWVMGLLLNEEFQNNLHNFILSNQYTVLISSLSLVEFFNPGWEFSKENDRTKIASQFYSKLPCVIVDPKQVWDEEINNFLDALDSLPIKLNLEQINESLRKESLLKLLRHDDLFLDQGLDIRAWNENYKKIKEGWLTDVEVIITNAINSGYLIRDSQGRFINQSSNKELFLFSLDLRFAEPANINKILTHQVNKRSGGIPTILTAVRLSSLLFWYSYIETDPANRIKSSGSDIGDFYHLSLIPYCSLFTVDNAMYRRLKLIKEPIVPVSCKVLTKEFLKEELLK